MGGRLLRFKHIECEYGGRFGTEVVKVWEETFKQYFKRKSERISSNIKDFNLKEANEDLNKLKKETKEAFADRDTVSIFGGVLGSFVLCGFAPIMYAKNKAKNSQELADRLSEYASSQGFNDYQKFVDDVNANVTTKTSGGLFSGHTEYFYSSPEYKDWFSNIEIIKDDVYQNMKDSVMQKFIGSGAIVAVAVACFMPLIVCVIQQHRYNNMIEKMRQDLDEKQKEEDAIIDEYMPKLRKDESELTEKEKADIKVYREIVRKNLKKDGMLGGKQEREK